MKIKTTENQVTTTIIDGLTAMGYKVWKAFAGSAPLFIEGKMVFRKARKGLETKGMPDLIAIGHNRILFIEVKSSIGKASPEQLEFIEGLENVMAVRGIVANKWEDVAKLISDNIRV